jgi:hypothetical protein
MGMHYVYGKETTTAISFRTSHFPLEKCTVKSAKEAGIPTLSKL